jgi:hypothetical protein
MFLFKSTKYDVYLNFIPTKKTKIIQTAVLEIILPTLQPE